MLEILKYMVRKHRCNWILNFEMKHCVECALSALFNKTLWQSPCADAMWSRWRRILCLHNLQTKHQLVQFDFNLQNIFSLSGSSVPTLDGGGGISSSLEANMSCSSSWIWRHWDKMVQCGFIIKSCIFQTCPVGGNEGCSTATASSSSSTFWDWQDWSSLKHKCY